MKKVRVLIILFVMFMVVPCTVNAETIADYRARIKAIEKEKAEKEKQSAEVQGRIDAANKRINEISVQIVQGRKEQENTQKEIERLDNEISIKDEEIKDLVAFYQISSSDNFYLKYIFGADSFEDFIYRFSVAEQLTDANDKLVDEMNALIKENEIKVKELKAQEVKLNALDNEIKAELEKLGDKKRELTENTLSADEEIATIEKQIAFFKKEGCKEDQDVNTCSLNAPSVHGFVLPTATGVVDNDGLSEYGYRWHPIWHDYRFHSGMDITANYGVVVNAAAVGKVVYAGSLWGFGNTIMIVHSISGQKYSQYTSLYGHLSRIEVDEGQIVQMGQEIGRVGSTGDSTGPHLHFQIMGGRGYDSSTTVNPRNFVNFPKAGVRW